MTDIATELVRICRHFGVFEREGVCCGTITVPQCLTLQQLLEGRCAMSALAARAGASLSAMTRLVDGLERNGWIERGRGGDDRRRVEVALTDAGAREARRLRDQTTALLEGVLERIPRGKRREVLAALRVLRQAMDEARDRGGGACC